MQAGIGGIIAESKSSCIKPGTPIIWGFRLDCQLFYIFWLTFALCSVIMLSRYLCNHLSSVLKSLLQCDRDIAVFHLFMRYWKVYLLLKG